MTGRILIPFKELPVRNGTRQLVLAIVFAIGMIACAVWLSLCILEALLGGTIPSSTYAQLAALLLAGIFAMGYVMNGILILNHPGLDGTTSQRLRQIWWRNAATPWLWFHMDQAGTPSVTASMTKAVPTKIRGAAIAVRPNRRAGRINAVPVWRVDRHDFRETDEGYAEPWVRLVDKEGGRAWLPAHEALRILAAHGNLAITWGQMTETLLGQAADAKAAADLAVGRRDAMILDLATVAEQLRTSGRLILPSSAREMSVWIEECLARHAAGRTI